MNEETPPLSDEILKALNYCSSIIEPLAKILAVA